MLGERIAKLRKSRRLSQYELAEKLGFSRGKLANYEQGSRQPDYETLKKFSDFFEVSTDYLLFGQEHTSKVSVAGQEVLLTSEELKVFDELKKYPILFHDLATDPEKKSQRIN